MKFFSRIENKPICIDVADKRFSFFIDEEKDLSLKVEKIFEEKKSIFDKVFFLYVLILYFFQPLLGVLYPCILGAKEYFFIIIRFCIEELIFICSFLSNLISESPRNYDFSVIFVSKLSIEYF